MSVINSNVYVYFTKIMFWMVMSCLLLTFTTYMLNIWLVTAFGVMTLIDTILLLIFLKLADLNSKGK